MPFTAQEKTDIRHHLGYANVSVANAMAFGSVVPTQAMFLLESNMDKILPEAEDRVRRYLCVLEEIECHMMKAIPDMQVSKTAAGTELQPEFHTKLEREYERWAGRLADILSVVFYPFALRFHGGSGRVQSIPVVG